MTTLTRMSLPLLVGAMLSAAIAGCASAPPIPIQASPAAFQALEGVHAHGDVLMRARGRREPYYRHQPNQWPAVKRPADVAQVLTIQFVHASGGTVDGRLEPYWDPDCQCEAVTTFRGRLDGKRLEGTFNTRLGYTGQANGRWSAYRRRVTELPSEEASHD
jgi:hypothetical protein